MERQIQVAGPGALIVASPAPTHSSARTRYRTFHRFRDKFFRSVLFVFELAVNVENYRAKLED